MSVSIDLQVLFGSGARYRLLRELYARPQDEHHLRGLASLAQVDPAQAHKLVRQLAEAGFCEQVARAPFPKYRASQDRSLQNALATLFSAGAPRPGANPMLRAEERSLRLHQAAVERLRRDPRAIQRAKQTLRGWISKYGSPAPRVLLEWEEILNRPVAEIAQLAVQRTQYGDRIRKSSPLSTLVSEEERRSAYAS